MALASLKNPTLPTEEEARLAAESSRKLAAIIGHGAAAHLRLIDGDDKITGAGQRHPIAGGYSEPDGARQRRIARSHRAHAHH